MGAQQEDHADAAAGVEKAEDLVVHGLEDEHGPILEEIRGLDQGETC